MIEIVKNEKPKKCDACSIPYAANFNIIFGHNPNRQHIATFCEGCLSDLKGKLENTTAFTPPRAIARRNIILQNPCKIQIQKGCSFLTAFFVLTR